MWMEFCNSLYSSSLLVSLGGVRFSPARALDIEEISSFFTLGRFDAGCVPDVPSSAAALLKAFINFRLNPSCDIKRLRNLRWDLRRDLR
jgi:hypothetical protein